MNDFRKHVQSHRKLSAAWQVIKKNSGKSSSADIKDQAEAFAVDDYKKIRSISGKLQRDSYKFSKSRGVPIQKSPGSSKYRPIVLSKVQDRVVQRCILDALTENEALKAYAFQPFSYGGIPPREKGAKAGVPAAISRLVDLIGSGFSHVIVADIQAFFTRIRPSDAISLISQYTDDQGFLDLVGAAIKVDLENLDRLWKHKDLFPRDDLGVRQGNCLSPFIGNLILSDFDQEMNRGDCACLRYIDDIIIVAPSGRAASARLRKAKRLLAAKGMRFADEKTNETPIRVDGTFEYLGIEFNRGQLRPSRKSRTRILDAAIKTAKTSLTAMKKATKGEDFPSDLSIPKTLNRISGMAKGWAHHYSFCNDYGTLASTDNSIADTFLSYSDAAISIAAKASPKVRRELLGYAGVATTNRDPIEWPLAPLPRSASPC